MALPANISLATMLASVTPENRSEFRPHISQLGAEAINWGNTSQDVHSGLDSVSESDLCRPGATIRYRF